MMKKYPKYVKCKTLPNKSGEVFTEFFVRMFDEQMDDDNGKKIKTPDDFLNRYYTTRNNPNMYKSLLKERKDKKVSFMRIDEVNKYKG